MAEYEDRKKEVLNTCMKIFVERGLSETSTRDLSRALNLNSSGLYYYFNNKEEVVIACAEESAILLENSLLEFSFKYLDSPKLLIKNILAKADELSPIMKFFVSVCTSKQYEDKMRPVLDKLSNRYEEYGKRCAETLGCEAKDVAPFLYMGIIAISNYMIYGEMAFIEPQLGAIQLKLEKLLLDKK